MDGLILVDYTLTNLRRNFPGMTLDDNNVILMNCIVVY